MNRILVAIRLQLVAWPASILTGWLVLGLAFAANLALWASIGLGELDNVFTGGLASIYFVVMAGYLTVMLQVFPFAIGFGVTRRHFYVAMLVVSAAQALAYGLVLLVLSLIERATDGWGVGLAFFRPGLLDAGNLPAQLGVYAVPFLLLASLAICLGVIYKRWGTMGIYTALVTVTAAVALSAMLLWMGDGWGAVGRWLGRQSVVSLAVGWPLLAAGALTLAGYVGIRRASP